MVAFNQTNILHFGAIFSMEELPFTFRSFHDGDAIAVRQQVAVGVFTDNPAHRSLSGLRIVPFVSAFRADERA